MSVRGLTGRRGDVHTDRVVSRLRRHPIVRVIVLVLLTWTAVDLLAPQLCAAEASHASASASVDDCFCCSHTVQPVLQAVILPDVSPVELPAAKSESPSAGVVRPLFRPPLVS